jgi:hypothetical protein
VSGGDWNSVRFDKLCVACHDHSKPFNDLARLAKGDRLVG